MYVCMYVYLYIDIYIYLSKAQWTKWKHLEKEGKRRGVEWRWQPKHLPLSGWIPIWSVLRNHRGSSHRELKSMHVCGFHTALGGIVPDYLPITFKLPLETQQGNPQVDRNAPAKYKKTHTYMHTHMLGVLLLWVNIVQNPQGSDLFRQWIHRWLCHTFIIHCK